MKQKTGLKLAAVIIGGLLGVSLVVFGGFFAIGRFTRAAGTEPTNVTVTDITQNSARVTWSTGSDSEGVVVYGTEPTSLTLFGVEAQRGTSHSVDLTLLSPATIYYFQIRIEDKTFTNAGAPWTFTTRDTTTSEAEVTVAPTTSAPRTGTPTPTTGICYETSCEAIKTRFGKGCTTQDYFLCVRKLTPTP